MTMRKLGRLGVACLVLMAGACATQPAPHGGGTASGDPTGDPVPAWLATLQGINAIESDAAWTSDDDFEGTWGEPARKWVAAARGLEAEAKRRTDAARDAGDEAEADRWDGVQARTESLLGALETATREGSTGAGRRLVRTTLLREVRDLAAMLEGS